MPELPEVETVCRELQSQMGSKAQIAKVELLRKDIRFEIPKALLKCMNGKELIRIVRRAKYILMYFENGILLNHLGMTGSWREVQKKELHDHLYLHLIDGRVFGYRDPRRFGFFDWIEGHDFNQNRFLKVLGPEPLENSEDIAAHLFEKSRGRSMPIKNFIMNQSILVGVGNIYASEALFRAKINPRKSCGRISLKTYQELTLQIQNILQMALSSGGSTIRDFKSSYGKPGDFQTQLLVYDREGQSCSLCKAKIKRIIQSGRSTFFCPTCQRA